VLQLLEAGGQRDLQVLFLDASDERLLHRFSETRRPHPLAAESSSASSDVGAGDALAVLDGVRVERERLAPLRASATRIIDTTNMSVHELRRVLVAHFGPASGGTSRMVTRLVSFGFKYGTPVDADLVLDVRFLDNPYFVPELKALTGLDEPVVRHVLDDPETKEFLRRSSELLEYVMPKYEREGKSYLTIAIGCTGGRHRSVVIADALARSLSLGSGELGRERERERTRIGVLHRDVDRGMLTAVDAASRRHPADAADANEGQDERSSAFELKGASSPPPSPTGPGATRGGPR
jgi:UPF0042 nucleotide-binding protein